MQLDALRREYLAGGLRRADLADCPFDQFRRWMQQAIELEINDPTAMVLATVNAQGQPFQRIVLLKGVDEQGFVFYTNHDSRKGQELAQRPQASLLFPWHGIDRQVKVGGQVIRGSEAQAERYFASRPRDSQLAAWASAQSQAIESRDALLARLDELKAQYEGQLVPKPPFWGGYCLIPEEIHFWQGGASRLHDSFRYHRVSVEADWQVERLAP